MASAWLSHKGPALLPWQPSVKAVNTFVHSLPIGWEVVVLHEGGKGMGVVSVRIRINGPLALVLCIAGAYHYGSGYWWGCCMFFVFFRFFRMMFGLDVLFFSNLF